VALKITQSVWYGSHLEFARISVSQEEEPIMPVARIAAARIATGIVAVALTTAVVRLPGDVAHAQCGNAYTDEMAGPGGTYGTSAECSMVDGAAELVPAGEVGIGGAIDERNATARDNPDAPPVDRNTATFEGEREP
jgi:hypothetical protein